MGHSRVGRGRIEEGLVRNSSAGRFGHPVVDFENDSLGSEFAVSGLVFLPDDGEGVEDVGRVVAVDAVEMEVGSVEFATERKAAGVVPAERRTFVSAVVGAWG